MPRRQWPLCPGGCAPGPSPQQSKAALTEGHSRFHTSGGEAVATNPIAASDCARTLAVSVKIKEKGSAVAPFPVCQLAFAIGLAYTPKR
jgi:hypothetical protein